MTVTHKTTKAKGDLIFLKETAEGNSFVHYNRHELLNASHSDGKGIHPVGIHPTAFHQASPALGTEGVLHPHRTDTPMGRGNTQTKRVSKICSLL